MKAKYLKHMNSFMKKSMETLIYENKEGTKKWYKSIESNFKES